MGDGTGSSGRFKQAGGLALDVDEMLLYVAEVDGHKVRGLALQTGEVFTVAGSGSAGSNNADGISATFNAPSGIAASMDGKALYVMDSGSHKVRTVTLSM